MGSSEVPGNGIEAIFVSDGCDRAAVLSQEGASVSVSGAVTTTVDKYRPWIWNPSDSKPKPLMAMTQVAASADEALKWFVTFETDRPRRQRR